MNEEIHLAAPTPADAEALARAAHEGQVDKAGQPYIEHPRAVAAVATVEESPCPRCGATGTLTCEPRFVATPLGEFSLAGVMMKAPARVRPVLECPACEPHLVGEVHADGRHVMFPQPAPL